MALSKLVSTGIAITVISETHLFLMVAVQKQPSGFPVTMIKLAGKEIPGEVLTGCQAQHTDVAFLIVSNYTWIIWKFHV